MNFKAILIFGVVSILPSLVLAEGDYDATVEILWGVYPVLDTTRGSTGTRLLLEGVEPSVASFSERYCARLLYVGDGSITPGMGYDTAVWWGDEAGVWDAVEGFGDSNPNVKGRLVLDGSLRKPITTFGNPDADSEGLAAAGFDPDAYFKMKWSSEHLVVVLVDRKTGLAYHLSDTEGGEAGVADRRLEGEYYGCHDDWAFWPNANSQKVYAESESGIVYLGAPLPARCVWMADRGLTTNDLEGVSDRRIALAAALGKTPDEVADMTLRIDGFDPETGTVSYGFDAEAPDGTTNAVTKLWYGAELRLLGGTELGSWTTTNVVDVATAGGRVAVPTDGDARFYRLELAVP